MTNMTNIILCGGSGTRLWPISRSLMPKQFAPLFEGRSLFQMTFLRNRPICSSCMIVSSTEQYFLAMDQLEALGGEWSLDTCRYLLEPIGRNTTPAIAMACMDLPEDQLVLVTPSDHLVRDEKAYRQAVLRAQKLAETGGLVTFGITPSRADTGFGYIEAEGEEVRAFHEKPDREIAQNYLAAGNYYWNSGMFLFRAGIFLRELRSHAPEIFDACERAVEKSSQKEGILRVREEEMRAIPVESVDYAVMERSDRVKVVPTEMGWSDLGSFDALYDELPKDSQGNTLNDRHVQVESKNNLVYGEDRLIATIDVEDLYIVDTKDALLIGKRGSSQKVKAIVGELKQKEGELHRIHTTAHRPWGTYTVLEDTPGYKIKRIVVKPGKRLSLQKHFHRNEHWIVVSGTATVTVGEETYLVRPNESTYIQMGQVHRLANEGRIPLVLIEAQVGEYTGEDDIVRLEDDFQRS